MKTTITIIVILVLVAVGVWIYQSSTPDASMPAGQDSSAVADTGNTSATDSSRPITSTIPPASTPASSGASVPSLPANPQPASTTVAIRNFEFTPKTINIKKGTTVVWTNYDSAPHTVTSDDSTFLNSPRLSAQQTYSQTFTEAGIFLYHCSVHPSMTGTVIVTN